MSTTLIKVFVNDKLLKTVPVKSRVRGDKTDYDARDAFSILQAAKDEGIPPGFQNPGGVNVFRVEQTTQGQGGGQGQGAGQGNGQGQGGGQGNKP